jgi:hypothetical protein
MPWFAHHDILMAIMNERFALYLVASFAEENACTAQFSSPQQAQTLSNHIAEQIAAEYDSSFCLIGVARTRFHDSAVLIPFLQTVL